LALRLHKKAFPKKGWDVLRAIKDIVAKYDAVLAGGTALSLQIGHRVSYDLDFFLGRDFKIETIIKSIREKGLRHRVVSEGEGALNIEVEGVNVSFLKYEYPFLEPMAEAEGIRLAGVLDIAAMKVIAINQRGAKRDFVDLYFILQTYPFHAIASHMVKRFGRERINPVQIGKSLVYFADADSNPEPAYLRGKALKWESLKKFCRTHVKQFVYDLDVALSDE